MFGALFGPLLHLSGPNIFKLECVLDLRFGKQLVIDASHLTAVGEAMVVVAAPFLESWYITSISGTWFVARCDASWDNILWLLSVCSLHYLQPRHWPTHMRICSEASYHLTAVWQCVRSLPRDSITLRNERCTICGWLTGKLYVDKPLCYECSNRSICGDCTYAVPDLGQRCYDCPTLLQYVNPSIRPFLALVDHAYEACDAMFRVGNYHPKKELERLWVQRYAFAAWHRSSKASACTGDTGKAAMVPCLKELGSQ